MKSIIVMGLVLIPALTMAAESCNVDSCGTTSDQRKCVMRSCPAAKTKVVTKKVEVPVVVEKVVEKVIEKAVDRPIVVERQLEVIKPSRKNRISLLGGVGPLGTIKEEVEGAGFRYSSQRGPLIGAQYQRLLTDQISIGGQFLSNSSVVLSVGVDF